MANIVQTAIQAGSFKTLVAAVQAAGLVDTLSSKGPFTVFAPNDDAFAKLPKGTVESLLNDKAKLTSVLTYHVVAGKVMSSDVRTGPVKTVQGQNAQMKVSGIFSKTVMIDNAKVIKPDIVTDNGLIHVIDSVILPE
ncbi:MAG TPA: fasciclin domain-containing protein [Conexivisphaerales archaeon]|nr:fasciclin domain-containing protein [Conexivisphaerales archaeon]